VEIFILIPHFFTNGVEEHHRFPKDKPLIAMTHVCRSWRDALLSTPSLWTQLDCSNSKSKQTKEFLSRSREQLLDVYQTLKEDGDVETFLSIAFRNIHRFRRLDMSCSLLHLEHTLAQFARPAPELKHLEIKNNTKITHRGVKLRSIIFGDHFPKLASLSFHRLFTDLCDFNFPSLTRFSLQEGTVTSVRDLTSFFEKCPGLEFIHIHPYYMPLRCQPPRERVQLAKLKELRFNHALTASGILDYFTLPKCTEMVLKGVFVGKESDVHTHTEIHPSSIDHLPVTLGITKAVVTPNVCTFSGPNGNLRLCCFEESCGNFNAVFFPSLSPISVLQIRELWVGQESMPCPCTRYSLRGQTAADIHGAGCY